jgi:endonuclease/exonuclease/phosphatase (EEP) superfamily protein YafD
LALLPSCAAVLMRLVPPTDDATAMVASFISYGVVTEVIAVVFFAVALVRARRRLPLAIMTGFSVLLLILQLIWLAPLFRSEHRHAAGRPFTVVSLNMRHGHADVDQLAAKTKTADVVVLVEFSDRAVHTVRTRLGDRFTHMTPHDPATAHHVMILSRFRLTDPQRLPAQTPGWAATAHLPRLGAVHVIAAHPCNPLCGGGAWLRQNHALLHTAESFGDHPTFIAGDFNSVGQHKTIRDFAAHGYDSATEIAGAGWMPTYPSNSWLPPLLPIDHVLVNHRLTAVSIRSFQIADTDHRGLIARLARAR